MQAIRDLFGHYTITGATHPLSESEILQAAQDILYRRMQRQGAIGRPTDAAEYLRLKLSGLPYEVFGMLWLDTRHQVMGFETLFTGSISGASVHPREVVRAALRANAASCIAAHNHPSGITEPSAADHAITEELKTVLRSIEVRLLDHIIVGTNALSMAERGWL